jgi:hypothetical protein
MEVDEASIVSGTDTYESRTNPGKVVKKNKMEKYTQQRDNVRVKPQPTLPYNFYNSKSKNSLAGGPGTLDSIEEDIFSQQGYNTSKYEKSDADEKRKT